MLNIGTMEMVVLLLVAFIVVGPKDLPKVARGVGKAVRYVRGLWTEVTAALNLEEEMEAASDLKATAKEAVDTVQEIKKTAADTLNPKNLLNPVEKEFNDAKKEIQKL
ncbi:MAG: Sec-independent protein translocase protein TatB [Defluviitaleaceae bacterium]|nr:Sec-independent protein translocase protein TatB [Defluviitaleaceae bacterium]